LYVILTDLLGFISKKSKAQIFRLILFLIFTYIFEILSLTLIFPFFFLVNNLDYIAKNRYAFYIYNLLDFSNKIGFLYFVSVLLILFSFLGMVLTIYTNKKLVQLPKDIGIEISTKLLNRSVNKKEIFKNVNIVSQNIIMPIIIVTARSLVSLLFLGVLLYMNYIATFVLLIFFASLYYVIYIIFHNKISKNRSKIKELKELLHSTNEIDELKSAYKELNRLETFNAIAGKLPRYFIVFAVFTLIVFASCYVAKHYQDTKTIIHLMLIYIVIFLKLLPQFQNIFIYYLKFKQNISYYVKLERYLKDENG